MSARAVALASSTLSVRRAAWWFDRFHTIHYSTSARSRSRVHAAEPPVPLLLLQLAELDPPARRGRRSDQPHARVVPRRAGVVQLFDKVGLRLHGTARHRLERVDRASRQPGPEHPDFLIEDTIWNSELYHYMWVNPDCFTDAWLTDIVRFLRRNQRWGIGIKNIARGYMLIFADTLMVTGPTFARLRSVDAVLVSLERGWLQLKKHSSLSDSPATRAGTSFLCSLCSLLFNPSSPAGARAGTRTPTRAAVRAAGRGTSPCTRGPACPSAP